MKKIILYFLFKDDLKLCESHYILYYYNTHRKHWYFIKCLFSCYWFSWSEQFASCCQGNRFLCRCNIALMSKETTKVENFNVILAHESKQFALIKVNSKSLWECTNGIFKKNNACKHLFCLSSLYKMHIKYSSMCSYYISYTFIIPVYYNIFNLK